MQRLFIVILGASLCISGCGAKSEIEKVEVRGQVVSEGKPMGKGRITFFPMEGTKGPVSGAEIRDGQYSVDSKGGVPIGKHRVEFHEFAVDPKRDPTRPPPMVENNILPPKFNTNSKLEFTVEPGKAITRDFDLDKEFPE